MVTVGIIGAGLAGLAAADFLSDAGHHVQLFDKARGPGGRLSARRIATEQGDVSFDHGAPYFTAHDPAFKAIVTQWQAAGVASLWPAAGPHAWVGVPAMNAPVKAMAVRHHIAWSTRIDGIMKTDHGWQLVCETPIDQMFDIVITAVPAEQAGALVSGWDADFAACAAAAPSDPCWTAMIAFTQPLACHSPIMKDDNVIGWAGRNTDKPGRTGPESWVIHATPAWSAAHLEEAQDHVLALLLSHFTAMLGTPLPALIAANVHRWRYAQSRGAPQISTGEGAAYRPLTGLGMCGDWLLNPGVEHAWRSGHRLGHMIVTAREGETPF